MLPLSGPAARAGEPRSRVFALPAVQALLIQATCTLPVLACAWMFPSLSIGHAVLLQGVLAALASAWRGLPAWWWAIQLLYPFMLMLAVAAGLPSWLFLLLFLILIAVFWSTYRTRVPLFLSGPLAWEQVAALLPAHAVRVVDIGSGLGGLVLHLARVRPESAILGIEIAPLPWLVSWIRARLSRANAAFLRGDYHALDLSGADVVFAYLSPAAMPALWCKVMAEMRPGSLLLSYEFVVPGVEPDFQCTCGKRILHGWNIVPDRCN